MSFKEKLETLKNNAAELADEAGKLHNKNLADIVRLGIARLNQAFEHPDIDRLDADEDRKNARDDQGAPLNSGGNALFAANDPATELQRTEAARRATFPGGSQGAPTPNAAGFTDPNTTLPAPAPFPGTAPAPGTTEGGAPVRDTSKLNPDAKQPGDPDFVKPNADFRDPNAVNLNNDGTLKTAPNSLGTTDERDNK